MHIGIGHTIMAFALVAFYFLTLATLWAIFAQKEDKKTLADYLLFISLSLGVTLSTLLGLASLFAPGE